MTISQSIRYEILRRDRFTCRYCGAQAPSVPLTVDHVVPVAHGGTDAADNLTTACQPCNSGKAATPATADTVADVSDVNRQWRQALSQALAMIADESAAIGAQVDAFGRHWEGWGIRGRNGEWEDAPRPPDWGASVRTMLGRGLTIDVLTQCVDIAMRAGVRDEWTYFCGVAWSTLRQAQQIVSGGQG